MAIATTNLKVYVRGTDLSTRLQSFLPERIRDEADVTVLSDTSRSFLPTLQRVNIAFAGLYDDDEFSMGEVLRQAHDADEEPVTWHAEGSTVGNRSEAVLTHKASVNMPENLAPGRAIMASFRASTRTPVALGQVVYNGLVNSDTATTPIEFTPALSTGQRVMATIHLIGITSTPAATFFLESDSLVGFGTPTVQATSASQTARGSVALSAIATDAAPITDTFWRVRWDWTTPGDFTAVISLGRTT